MPKLLEKPNTTIERQVRKVDWNAAGNEVAKGFAAKLKSKVQQNAQRSTK